MTLTIVPRAAWGFDGWKGGVSPYSVALSSRTEFFVHYEGGEPVGSQTGPSVPRSIHAFHKNGNGWAGIGYNFVVDQLGNVYEGRGWNLVGAHCPDHNVSGIGVQVHIGGSEQPSQAAKNACRALYDMACRMTGRTLAKRGHRDGFATECPGANLYAWVKAGMPASAVVTPPPVVVKPTPTPTPEPAPTPQEHDMVIVDQKESGIWLLGPGYAHNLNGSETSGTLSQWNDKIPASARLPYPYLKLADGQAGIDHFRLLKTIHTAARNQ